MRLIFITREGYKQPGARIRSYGFSSILRKKGIDCEVFSFVDHLGAKAGKDERGFLLCNKIRCIQKGFLYLLRKKEGIFVINRFNYHAIPAWVVSKLVGMPFIFDMDDWEAREDIGYYFNILPKSKAEFLTRLMAKSSRLCLAASHYLVDYLQKLNKNIFYIPTGIDLQKFDINPIDKKDTFVFSWHGSVNRIEVLKYLSFIIDCFTILKEKYDFIRLLIIGDGIFGIDLRQLLKKKNLFLDIDFKGWIEPEFIPTYLRQVDVGLAPLLEETRFNLSKFPVKILEYMAMGIPVVASSIGEARYIIKDGNNGFLASNKDEFIFRMEELIKSPMKIKRMGVNARQTVEENYSLESIGDALYKIIMDNFR